jgi:glycerol kinase
MTRDTGPEHFARAALESIAYQTYDLLAAFEADSGTRSDPVRVDGGMVANDWFVQFLSDILGTGIERPRVQETTALGAAFLAGLGAGVYKDLAEVKTFWHLDQAFQPDLPENKRADLLFGWHEAVRRVKSAG